MRKFSARRARIWHSRLMLDRFDLALLNQFQRDASQTAEQLSKTVPLSPSAIARRLRRLRREIAQLKMENDILKKAAIILGTKPLPENMR